MLTKLCRPGRLVTLFLLLALISACHTFYKAVPGASANPSQSAGSIDSLQKMKRYFILRTGRSAFSMENVQISEDRKTLTCRLDQLLETHMMHLTGGIRGRKQYKKGNLESMYLLSEVHLYTPYDSMAKAGAYTLPLDRVQKIEIIEHDRKRTTNSYVIGAIGYTLGAVALVAIIGAALKSSCPFVSAYDGKEFTLQGEIYGGSIYPQLARHDYIPLRMQPTANGTLEVKISNELKERQYTDIADLWVVTHDRDIKVLSDEQGDLHSIAKPQSPESATLNGCRDLLPALRSAGDNQVVYMDDSSRADAQNEATIRFAKPHGVSKAKLILTLKNSYWLDLLYGEVAKGFGSYYGTYIREQRNKPTAELLKWVREQRIPLEIAVHTTEGWIPVTTLTTIGPVANREVVVPIDLSQTVNGPLELRLSTGFLFWEIDYAAIDYTPDTTFTVERLKPVRATDESGRNVLPSLTKEDGLYLEQPEIGNVATLTYQPATPAGNTTTQTFLLHAKGYYEHVREFTSKPDVNFLAQFRKPGAFPLFGMRLYQRTQEQNLKALAGN